MPVINPTGGGPVSASDITGTLSMAQGGTGKSNAADVRTDLGLGNVNNTSDANKPVSSATQTALDAKAATTDLPIIKKVRVTTGEVSAGSSALITATWASAFADTNYTVSVEVLDSTTTSLSLSDVHVESITAEAVTVRVLNNALGALTGTLHVVGIHD